MAQRARWLRAGRFTLNPADSALQAAAHARTTLRAGFTTVRNLGDFNNSTVALREAIKGRAGSRARASSPRTALQQVEVAVKGGAIVKRN